MQSEKKLSVRLQEAYQRMKKITMFMMASCPYCQQASRRMHDLIASEEKYKTIDVETIDESVHPDIADQTIIT